MKEVVLQRIGMQIPQATITKWHKAVGEEIREREPLYDVESVMGKITMRSFYSGTVSEILVEEGTLADVGSVIAIIDEE
jgi:pyruvate/2-oxoglutarate dehydrogenase complex dihydrolipoamide acyltransferase (E2) component